nr:aminoacyl-tRNA hydrolase [Haliscomenobacter sp.]
MKYLIAGLGNIGAEYANTRHNVGFLVVDQLAKDAEATWESEHLGSIAKIKHKSRIFVLLKPSTYMNRSGKSVNYWLQKEKIPVENLLVILTTSIWNLANNAFGAKAVMAGTTGSKTLIR